MEKYINKVTCADSLDIMRELPDKCIDLVLTDPPYGIGVAKKPTFGGSIKAQNKRHLVSDWDDFIPSKEYFDEIKRISKNQIIFGGNYFIEHLSNSSCWIVWDKDNGDNNFADCELAWTSFKTSVRKFKWKWQGMLQELMGKNKENRQHPTQKPLELMRWCLENYSKEGDLVLDCFGGSGTTARACKDLGRDFIIIEKEQKYCDIANERLRQEVLF